jgi:hypothetical protein
MIVRLILRALLIAACVIPHTAFAAQAPRNAAEFDRLPALGKVVEGGMEKDYRFRTFLVSKRAGARGEVTTFIGQVHMRVQDIAGGVQRRPGIRKWEYAARCTGPDNTLGVNTQSIAPREKDQTYVFVAPGSEPGTADRTWFNVWYAVCRGEFEKYPRNKEE